MRKIYRDIIDSSFFLKILFLTIILQTAFGLEKDKADLILNQIIIWGLIPLLFMMALINGKIFVKNSLPPEIVFYFYFIILVLANYPQITDNEIYVIVLR